MNNLTHTLVDCYENFHATIFKYTRDLRLQLHVCYNQQQCESIVISYKAM